LIVDDEPGVRSALSGVLRDEGYRVDAVESGEQCLDRIVRESSTYYLLAYTSSNNKIDGKYRRTQINVKRTGVEAFYRPGYIARRQ
jgi:CheY-like chemotaxis protein